MCLRAQSLPLWCLNGGHWQDVFLYVDLGALKCGRCECVCTLGTSDLAETRLGASQGDCIMSHVATGGQVCSVCSSKQQEKQHHLTLSTPCLCKMHILLQTQTAAVIEPLNRGTDYTRDRRCKLSQLAAEVAEEKDVARFELAQLDS